MSAEYVIKYSYYSWIEGCGCCSDSSSELTIYEAHSMNDCSVFMEYVGWLENEAELREFIATYHPEYNNFTVHEDTRWF